MECIPIPNPEKRSVCEPVLCRQQGGLSLPVHHAHTHAGTDSLKAWLYFTRIHADNAHCHKCNKSFACKGGNTSNLLKHLGKVVLIQMGKCSFHQPSLYFLSRFPIHLMYVMLAGAHTELIRLYKHGSIAISNH